MAVADQNHLVCMNPCDGLQGQAVLQGMHAEGQEDQCAQEEQRALEGMGLV